MNTTYRPQLEVPGEAISNWEQGPTISSHNLHESPLFDDEALVELLDSTERDNVYALHMGTDLLQPGENRLALHDHLSGRELLDAVRGGRLWLNVTRIHEHAPAYTELAESMYAQLADSVPGFAPEITTLTLLISSPKAMVYYHVDGPANLLFHIRGDKQIWIYPPDDEFISPHDLEDIFASVSHEYIDYDPRFDERATVIDLQPGMLAGWAPNSPHRVANGDSFNVSLSTEHYTPQQRKKARIYQANRVLRTKLGYRNPGTDLSGIAAVSKQALYAAARRAGRLPSGSKQHTPQLRVTPGAPDNVQPL
ncbi:MAG: hypothetical protein AB8G14_05520 [Ilumatobacter sp.]